MDDITVQITCSLSFEPYEGNPWTAKLVVFVPSEEDGYIVRELADPARRLLGTTGDYLISRPGYSRVVAGRKMRVCEAYCVFDKIEDAVNWLHNASSKAVSALNEAYAKNEAALKSLRAAALPNDVVLHFQRLDFSGRVGRTGEEAVDLDDDD